MREFEEVLDSLLLNASMFKLTKESLDLAAKEFNERVSDYDISTATEPVLVKLEEVNKIFDDININ